MFNAIMAQKKNLRQFSRNVCIQKHMYTMNVERQEF